MIFDEGIFDQDPIEDFLRYYTLDAILEEIAKPISYQLDAQFGGTGVHSYLLDANIYKPVTSYLIDAVLVHDRNNPKFQESIINAIIWSCGRATEKLSEAIALMGLRLQLPYATTDDLDLYWSKILAMKRRYNEPDEDFRRRLTIRLSIMKSSGTKPECEAILNNIMGMVNAVNLKTYWPAEVCVNWNSFWAMKTAEANYAVIKEALDGMLAAGVSWSTAFPYKEYNLDANLIGRHSTSYSIDAGISKEKYCTYLLRTDLLDQNSASQDLDAYLEVPHFSQQRLDALVRADKSKSELLDVNISHGRLAGYETDVVLKQKRTKPEEVDAIVEAKKTDYYRTDMIAEIAHRGSYMLSANLVASS